MSETKYALWLTPDDLRELQYLISHAILNVSYPEDKTLYDRHRTLESRVDDMLTHMEDSEK